MTRQRLIASLIAMFEAEHGSTPQWMIDLHHRSTDEELIARQNNWRQNYPHHHQRHGLYVM